MTIRPTAAADLPRIIPMVARINALHRSWDAAKYGFIPGIERHYGAWLTQRASDPRSVFLVAENEDAALAGFVVGDVEREIPIYAVKEFGFIHDLWVEEEFRGRGIGQRLARAAIEKFRAIGVEQIRLDTAAANEGARKLFSRFGFRRSVTEMLLEIGPSLR